MIPNKIVAHQWFKNGDHPEDNCKTYIDPDGKPFLGGGSVVRRFRSPTVSENKICEDCGVIMHLHGWIDGDLDHTVCPGDYVAEVNGAYISIKL